MRRKVKRTGSAAVEAAVCLPIVVLVMFGSISVSSGIHQQHRVRAVLHECCKIAAKPESVSGAVGNRAKTMLNSLEISRFTIRIVSVPRTFNTDSVESVEPFSLTLSDTSGGSSGLESVPRGTILRMTLTCPRMDLLGSSQYLGDEIVASAVFVKEG